MISSTLVDVSDTSMAATGTNTKLTLAGLITFAAANGLAADADLDAKPSSTTVDTIWTGNQAAYDAIGTKDPATLYFITA